MTAPVDVLGVLYALAADLGDTPGTAGPQVSQACAAVAELIEAASDVTAEVTRHPEPDTPMARLDAALARVQGVQP